MIVRALQVLAQVATFTLALAFGCWGIGRVLPFPPVPQVQEKLAWLAAHREEYTALFVGSSRVRQHLVPALFDQLATEEGVPMRSFNLGVDNLFAPEDGYVLDRALALRLPHLRWVFIELGFFRSNFAGQNPETIRALYWHDWERTRRVWQQVADRDLPQFKQGKKRRWQDWLTRAAPGLEIMVQHGRLFLQRLVNFGRGAAWLEQRAGWRGADDPAVVLGPARDGFSPRLTQLTEQRAALAEYQQQLAALAADPARARRLNPIPQQHLEAMLAQVRALGAEPVLLLAPTAVDLVSYPQRAVAPLFDFSDPRRWPALFEPRHRADPAHLNAEGAEIFTRLLAAQFLALRREQR